MVRHSSFRAVGIAAACFFVLPGLFARADDAAPKQGAKPDAQTTKRPETDATPKDAATATKPQDELSPAMAALRDGIRRTLEAHAKQPFNTRQNTATEIMDYCLAFGCNTEVSAEGVDGKLNGITCLCWNYPCAGFEMIAAGQKHLVARIGYGTQEHPGEFLAMLAMSGVQPNYPARAGHQTRTVADLVESEKLGCRSGSDMSLKLIGLSYYVDEPTWKNDLGETWSIDRMLKEEMSQPVVSAAEGGMNRLMGLSYAVERRGKRHKPIDGQFLRAKNFIAEFQTFALQLQNADGSWGPNFFASRGSSNDPAAQLRSTGRVLEWLAMSLPEVRLDDAEVIKAVEYVANLLGTQRYQWNAPSLSTREIAALGHALHGLAIYNERAFTP